MLGERRLFLQQNQHFREKDIKIINRKITLLGTALLGLSATFGIVNPTVAAPHNDRQQKRDVKEARKEVKQERKDLRRANTPAERRDARRDLNEAREDLRDERRDSRRNNGRGRDDNRGRYNNRGRTNNRPGWNNRSGNNQPNWNNRTNPNTNYGYGNSRNPYGAQSYTGTVTRVRSNQSFDINIGGRILNVYLNSSSPRGLSVGDTVRVNGVQQNNNDIRNASVSLIRNR